MPGQAACVSTPPGQYWSGIRDMECPAGTFSSTGATSLKDCEPCGIGFYSLAGVGYCSPCGAGTFAASDKDSCNNCQPGKISGIAAKVCTDCEIGKFNNKEKQDACSSCPQYQGTNSSEGQTACECNDGFVSKTDSAGEASCVCEPGFTLENGFCVSCQAGFYKESISNDPCNSCKKLAVKNSVLTDSDVPAVFPSSCICSVGEFLYPLIPDKNSSFIGECRTCPEGTICDRPGISLNTTPTKPMYWRTSNESAHFENCHFDDACKGNAGNETKTVCRVGYEGPLCAVCSSSYSIQGAGQLSKCKKCDGDATATIAIWTTGFGLLLLLSVIFCYCKQKATAALEDLEERRSNSVFGRYSEKFDEGKLYTCLKRWIYSVSYNNGLIYFAF